jgi:hypothetical protein
VLLLLLLSLPPLLLLLVSNQLANYFISLQLGASTPNNNNRAALGFKPIS